VRRETKLMILHLENHQFRRCVSDGGRPPEIGLQRQVSNRPGAAVVQKAVVVSDLGKGARKRASGECREGEREWTVRRRIV